MCTLVQAVVETAEDVLQMMAEGSRNRHSAETKMNERSSRSHQVLTVIVDGYNRLTGARTHGCLHLVDLAGSERNDKSEAKGASGTLGVRGKLHAGYAHTHRSLHVCAPRSVCTCMCVFVNEGTHQAPALFSPDALVWAIRAERTLC